MQRLMNQSYNISNDYVGVTLRGLLAFLLTPERLWVCDVVMRRLRYDIRTRSLQ